MEHLQRVSSINAGRLLLKSEKIELEETEIHSKVSSMICYVDCTRGACSAQACQIHYNAN